MKSWIYLLGALLCTSAFAAEPTLVSFYGLDQKEGTVEMLGTIFKTAKGDSVHFIPAVSTRGRGVWSTMVSKDAEKEAMAKVEAGKHSAAVVSCELKIVPGNEGGGTVTTGVYRGPIHSVVIAKVTYLDAKEAKALAEKLLEDPEQLSSFLKRAGF